MQVDKLYATSVKYNNTLTIMYYINKLWLYSNGLTFYFNGFFYYLF